jgi:hypothetical protein
MNIDEPDPEIMEALRRSGGFPVILQLDITTVVLLVSLLQVAMRHPMLQEKEGAVRRAREFIADAREQLASREPVLAKLIDMGFDPKHDV